MARKKALPLIEDTNSIPQEALVPENEQPYPIPEHWNWVRLGSILHPMESRKPSGAHFIYIDIGAIDNKTQSIANPKTIAVVDAPSRATRAVKPGDTLFSLIRPYLMNVAYVHQDLSDAIASTGFYVCSPTKLVHSRYLFHLLSSHAFVNRATERMRGDNSPSIKNADFVRLPVPLPPLDDQQRIVNYLHTNLAKVDDVIAKLEDHLAQCEERKATLIQAAVSGTLTADWREEQGRSLDSWNKERFGSLAQVRSNLVAPQKYPNLPHIAPDSIEKGTGKLLKYRTVSEDGVKSGKHLFFAGQILYSKIRPYLSKVVIADFDGLCSADMYPIEAKQNRDYLFFLMLSREFVYKTSTAGSRTVLPKINQKELNALTFNIPPHKEQEVIVGRLKDALDAADQVDQRVSDAVEALHATRSSFTAAALAGHIW